MADGALAIAVNQRIIRNLTGAHFDVFFESLQLCLQMAGCGNGADYKVGL